MPENEMFHYQPGIREWTAGWRETGHYIRSKAIIIFH